MGLRPHDEMHALGSLPRPGYVFARHETIVKNESSKEAKRRTSKVERPTPNCILLTRYAVALVSVLRSGWVAKW